MEKKTSILKLKVDYYFETIKNQDPFLCMLFNGQYSIDDIALYVKNITYLVIHSQRHISMALKEAIEKNDEPCIEYFRLKEKEESGHEKWGHSDLKNLIQEGAAQEKLKVLTATKQLMTHVEKTILKDYRLYLAYIFFAEYFTVIAGGPLMAAISKHKIVKPEYFSILNNHVELDKEHADDLILKLPHLIDVEKLLILFSNVIDTSFEKYNHILRELYNEAQKENNNDPGMEMPY